MKAGKLIMLVLILLSFSTLVFALTKQEKLDLLEEKFLKGEITEELFKKLEKKYKAEAAKPGSAPAGSGSAAVSKDNRVINGNFETPDPINPSIPQGWYAANNKSTWVDGGRNGGKCLRLESTGYVDYYYGWFSLIKVKPHTKYVVTCWVKTEVQRFPLKMIFLDFKPNDINLPITADWTEFRTTVDSGEAKGWGGGPIRKFRNKPFVAFTNLTKHTGGVAYVDDLSITELKE